MTDIGTADNFGATAGSVVFGRDFSVASIYEALYAALAQYFAYIQNQRKCRKAVTRMAKAIALDAYRVERITNGRDSHLTPGLLRAFFNETATALLLDSVLNPRPAYQKESREQCYALWVEVCNPADASQADESWMREAFRLISKQFEVFKIVFNANELRIIYRETEKQVISLYAIADRAAPESGSFLEYIKEIAKERKLPDRMGIFRYSDINTPFAGRSDELTELKKFCFSDKQLSWWSVTGGGGAGKSRLAIELCRYVPNERKNWYCVFLPVDFFIGMDRFGDNWSLDRNLLAVIDSPNLYIEKVGIWLKRLIESNTINRKIRVIILERERIGERGQSGEHERFGETDDRTGYTDYSAYTDYPDYTDNTDDTDIRQPDARHYDIYRQGYRRWNAAAEPAWLKKLQVIVGGRVLKNICYNKNFASLRIGTPEYSDCLDSIDEYCKNNYMSDADKLRIADLWAKYDPGFKHLPILSMILSAVDDNVDLLECTDLPRFLDKLYECEMERVLSETGASGRDAPVFVATVLSLAFAAGASTVAPRSDCVNRICAAAGLDENSDEASNVAAVINRLCRYGRSYKKEMNGAADDVVDSLLGVDSLDDATYDVADGAIDGLPDEAADGLLNGAAYGLPDRASDGLPNDAAYETAGNAADDVTDAATDNTNDVVKDRSTDGDANGTTDSATYAVADVAADVAVDNDANNANAPDTNPSATTANALVTNPSTAAAPISNPSATTTTATANAPTVSESVTSQLAANLLDAIAMSADPLSSGPQAVGPQAADPQAAGLPVASPPIGGPDLFGGYFIVKTFGLYGATENRGKSVMDILWNQCPYTAASFVYRIVEDQFYEYGMYDLASCYNIIIKVPKKRNNENVALYSELMVFLSAKLDASGTNELTHRLEWLRGKGFGRDRHIASGLARIFYNLSAKQDAAGMTNTYLRLAKLRGLGFERDKEIAVNLLKILYNLLIITQDWKGRKETVKRMEDLRDQGFEYDKDMALILAQSMFILTAKQEEDGIKNTVARLEALRRQGFEQDRDITLELLKALLNLTAKQDGPGRKLTVERMEALRNQGFGQDMDIALELAKAMLNLTIKQEESGIEETVLRIENLRNQGFERNKDLALVLAQAMLNLTTKQGEAGITNTVKRLEALRNQGFERDSDITRELSTALFNLTTRQDEAGVKKTAERLEELRNAGFTKDRDITLRLAQALFSLTTKQGAIVRKEASDRIDALRAEGYEQDREMTLTLVKSLYNLTIEQDSEGTKETVSRIEEICGQGYEQDKEIKLLFAKSLFNLTTKLDENGIAETVSKLESLRNQN